MTLKGRWCDSTVPNLCAPTEDKRQFYEELQQVFDKYSRYHM
jgi:hypothetical protein